MKRKVEIVVSVAIVIIASIGIIINYNNTESFWNFISYFTIQSNIIVVCFFSYNIYCLLKNTTTRNLEIFRGAATLYIMVTGLVFYLLLSNKYDPTGLRKFADIIVHYFTPIATVAYTVFLADNSNFQYRDFLKFLIYPCIYLIYSLIRGFFLDFYPYFFLDPRIGGYDVVFIWIFIFAILFSSISLIFIHFNKRKEN